MRSSGDELRLYELIWQRTVASQMADATGHTVSVRLGALASSGEDAEFSAAGTVVTFPGFLKVYVEGSDDTEADKSGKGEKERRLPQLTEGDTLTVTSLEAEGHSTNPPARFTEASLVRALEERGIGRPSTFASIMGTILDRGYVFKKGSALVPTFLAFAVVQLLEQHFGDLVDYDFTAEMEGDLDRIASGEARSREWLASFYFGVADNGASTPGLKAMVSDRLGEIDAREISSYPIGESGIMVRVGRYGTYLQQGEQRANVPDDMAPDELTVDVAEELLARPSGDRELGVDPDSGREIVAKSGRYGPYVTEILPEGSPKSAKPRTASLFATMTLDSIKLEDALRLLTLPRVLGESDGEEITAQNGRYGPYITRGKDSRSLESEEQLFTVTLEEALALLAQPKTRGRQAAAARGPLRELGDDPGSGKPVVVKDGRFGAYVTDGETNATLRKGDDPESVTLERAAELLAEKRAKGPAPKKKAAPRKAAPRKTAAKKAAPRKTAAKKVASKKA